MLENLTRVQQVASEPLDLSITSSSIHSARPTHGNPTEPLRIIHECAAGTEFSFVCAEGACLSVWPYSFASDDFLVPTRRKVDGKSRTDGLADADRIFRPDGGREKRFEFELPRTPPGLHIPARIFVEDGHKRVRALVDTGSEVCVVRPGLAHPRQLHPRQLAKLALV